MTASGTASSTGSPASSRARRSVLDTSMGVTATWVNRHPGGGSATGVPGRSTTARVTSSRSASWSCHVVERRRDGRRPPPPRTVAPGSSDRSWRNGVGGVGRPTPVELDAGRLEAGTVGQRCGHHGVTVLRRAHRAVLLLPRLIRHDHQHPVESQGIADGLGHLDVPRWMGSNVPPKSPIVGPGCPTSGPAPGATSGTGEPPPPRGRTPPFRPRAPPRTRTRTAHAAPTTVR